MIKSYKFYHYFAFYIKRNIFRLIIKTDYSLTLKFRIDSFYQRMSIVCIEGMTENYKIPIFLPEYWIVGPLGRSSLITTFHICETSHLTKLIVSTSYKSFNFVCNHNLYQIITLDGHKWEKCMNLNDKLVTINSSTGPLKYRRYDYK